MSVRAFELTAAIQWMKLTSGQSKTQIECLECCGKNIYIGTDDCFVVHYLMEEIAGPNGRVMVNSKRRNHKFLGLRKPVFDLKAASALNRILVLCDNTLILLNMFDLEPIPNGSKIKGVSSICVNRYPLHNNPFSVEICVALKKRYLQLYTVTEDKFVHCRDVHLPEPPVTMAMNGTTICLACTSQYLIVNYETGLIVDLFPYQPEQTIPFVLRVAKDEFLLSGPSSLGMFVTSGGTSQRPPLQWSDHLVSVAYHHPYILAMDDEFITVHSLLDQQQKQAISFSGGRILGEYDGRLLVASNKDVYLLVPVAVEKQIQSLLTEKRVSEALEIAKNARSLITDKQVFSALFTKIQQQAGFVELAACRWNEAKELFKLSEIDVREVISLYPDLLMSNSTFTRAMPPLHEIADIDQLSGGNTEKMVLYRKFIVDYLEEIRDTAAAEPYQQEVDTALVKLYAAARPHELLPFICANNSCVLKEGVATLQSFGCYHALAMMYKLSGDAERALQTWSRLVDGELEDESFPGLEFVVEMLANLEDADLVWRYVDWALTHDQILGIKILTERPASEMKSNRFNPDAVLDCLDATRFSQGVILYLEYLVFTKLLTEEKFHTLLAMAYLDDVSLQLQKQNNSNGVQHCKSRQKLQYFLRWSSYYRVQMVISRVKKMELHIESAILYGKLEDHDQALRILVHRLGDYAAAQEYCQLNSEGRDATHRKRLFHSLLSVYLDPNQGDKEELVLATIDLVNNESAEFDAVKVIQQLPESWLASFLEQFLTRTLRMTLHRNRMTRIECQLSRVFNLQLKRDLVSLSSTQICITEKRFCQVCKKSFREAEFTCFPNKSICHNQCVGSHHSHSSVTAKHSKF